jgi:membrane-bound lytic murein transglycosylase D
MLEVAADELAPLNRHTVKKGETLLSISKKLKVSRADLAEANYLSPKAALKTGQQLIIPRAPTLLLAANTETTSPPVETPAIASGPAAPDAVPASAPARPAPRRVESAPEKVIHRVRRGDTLFSIAKRYETTVQELKEWNRLRGNAIQIGQRLTIFRDGGPATN